MKYFVLGVLSGAAGVVLATVGALVYVSKRKQWSESTRPPAVPYRYRVETLGDPVGSATIRTARVRPRKRPE